MAVFPWGRALRALALLLAVPLAFAPFTPVDAYGYVPPPCPEDVRRYEHEEGNVVTWEDDRRLGGGEFLVYRTHNPPHVDDPDTPSVDETREATPDDDPRWTLMARVDSALPRVFVDAGADPERWYVYVVTYRDVLESEGCPFSVPAYACELARACDAEVPDPRERVPFTRTAA